MPLTENIILFNQYCYKATEEAGALLRINLQNVDDYKQLSEAVLALVISLNRKRIGDIQFIKTEFYINSRNNVQENCLNLLTESEKKLTKYFKRIISIGKGSKAIPILFPKKIQAYVELLILCRHSTRFIPKENQFLFALVGSSNKWINGSTVLKKYAKLCGAKYPERITSSRLRKRIATILQILSLNEVEMEQVASFMGHTKKTHEEFYRYWYLFMLLYFYFILTDYPREYFKHQKSLNYFLY